MSTLRRGTNLPRMGDFNRSVILEAIRRAPEGSSRTELVDTTGLSAQTVTNITRFLLEEGLIEEAGRQISGPGKPRVTLRLIAESRTAVGVHLDPTMITTVLLDLAGAVVAHRTRRTPSGDPHSAVEAMAEEVAALLAGTNRGAVAGVGVAAPGPLDADRGTVIDPPKLHEWHRVPLRDELAARTGLPVVLEKDTAAAAAGELWNGAHAADASFLFVYLGTGIGCGLVRDGEVVGGSSHNVGEVGHIIVDAAGPVCACGQRGCVDVVCTPEAIVQRAERAGLFADQPAAHGEGSVDERLTLLCERAASGDAEAEGILARAARDLAVMIAAVMNMMDAGGVVLGGPFWSRLAPVYLREMPRAVHAHSATRAVREIPLISTVLGDDVGAVGAACLVLDRALTPRTSALLLGS